LLPPNAGLIHFVSRRPAENLRQIKNRAISSMAGKKEALMSAGLPPGILVFFNPARQ
jgi:hypothetical protein